MVHTDVLKVDVLVVDVLELDVLVVDVLELDVLGARRIVRYPKEGKLNTLPVLNGRRKDHLVEIILS